MKHVNAKPRKRRGSKHTANKTFAMRAHCRRRMLERYGVQFNKVHRNEMKDIITCHLRGTVAMNGNAAELVAVRSNRVQVYDVTYYGRDFRMVYDNIRREFCTALDLDMVPGDNDYY